MQATAFMARLSAPVADNAFTHVDFVRPGTVCGTVDKVAASSLRCADIIMGNIPYNLFPFLRGTGMNQLPSSPTRIAREAGGREKK